MGGELDVCCRAGAAALRNNIARTAFALAALGGHAQLELNVVECHARPRTTCDGLVTDSVANANDHEAGWDGKRVVQSERVRK